MIKRPARVIFIKRKNYLIYMALTLIKLWFPKMNLMVRKAHRNVFLEIKIMMSSDHYV